MEVLNNSDIRYEVTECGCGSVCGERAQRQTDRLAPRPRDKRARITIIRCNDGDDTGNGAAAFALLFTVY